MLFFFVGVDDTVLGVSMFTSIGTINLTMVVNSTNIIMMSDRDFRIMFL